MFTLVSPRRMMKGVCRRSISKRDRGYDYMDSPPDGWCWRPILLLLAVPALYYLYSVVIDSGPYTEYYVTVNKVDEYSKTVEELTGKENFTKLMEDAKNKYMQKMSKYHRTPKPNIRSEYRTKRENTSLPVCTVNMTMLGQVSIINKITVNVSGKTHDTLDNLYPSVKKGGYYSPPNCLSRHNVAIIVPYRNRSSNLAVFLFNIHPFLIKQKLAYRIFVIEQFGNQKFNKGRLYNAAFKEIPQYGDWKCLIFHDVDLLPLDGRILYTCPTYPRHMCASIKEKQNDKKYHTLFGGVTAITPEHYAKANGYSNMYWGWGGEDNDMFWRLRSVGLPVVRYDKKIARFTSLPHTTEVPNRNRFQLLHTVMERWKDEGLSNVEYKVLAVHMKHLYTHIIVDINPYNDTVSYVNSLG